MLVRGGNTYDHVCEEDGDRVQLVLRPAQAYLGSGRTRRGVTPSPIPTCWVARY
jgi:hypothetical protein